MPVKIRLQRHGRKGYAYYHIVVADSRAPRDGKFIERLGSYNPNTNPATVDLNFERALYWVQTGAQPTDTARNLLSDKGVYLKNHLLGGVKKNAFSEAEAEKRFDAWQKGKEQAAQSEKDKMKTATLADKKARLEAEKAINATKAEELAKKKAAAIEAQQVKAAQAEEATEEPAAEETEVKEETAE
ncbi:MAG: 30S ribosomal protein S16 [Prevotellaceae bacterium]|jgi:small subunit ribosomal protein S16|nr:30S ribosomal protein S16 [Prevotellaceae bacterium]